MWELSEVNCKGEELLNLWGFWSDEEERIKRIWASSLSSVCVLGFRILTETGYKAKSKITMFTDV